MSTIRLYSDLHLPAGEGLFQRHLAWVDTFPIAPDDTVILAGDITSVGRIREVLIHLAERHPDAYFIFLPGNHEYWHTTHGRFWAALFDGPLPDNVTVLDCEAVTINDQRFIGATMWYPESRQANHQAPYWSDYHAIIDVSILPGRAWFYAENARFRDYLSNNLREGDIVLTHMLPSKAAVAPQWLDSDTNCFFVSPMDDLIHKHRPKAWLFGHTHQTIIAKVGDTELFSNPRGYTVLGLPLVGDPNPNFLLSGDVFGLGTQAA